MTRGGELVQVLHGAQVGPHRPKVRYGICRNLPQVHTIVRMMRMIGEIVCPSVILLGALEIVAEEFLVGDLGDAPGLEGLIVQAPADVVVTP